jgi:hypothetical protein
MQHAVGGLAHPFGTHRPGRWVQERQQLDSTTPDVLMGLPLWLPLGRPGRPRLWDRLIRPGFILAPYRHPSRLSQLIGRFNQLFFSSVCGSTTFTTPLLRLRWAVPVGHQVRVRW